MLSKYAPRSFTGVEYEIEYQLMISTSNPPDGTILGSPHENRASPLILIVDAAYPFMVMSPSAIDETIIHNAGVFIRGLRTDNLTELFPFIPEGTQLDQVVGVRACIEKIDCPTGDVIESTVVDYLRETCWLPVFVGYRTEPDPDDNA